MSSSLMMVRDEVNIYVRSQAKNERLEIGMTLYDMERITGVPQRTFRAHENGKPVNIKNIENIGKMAMETFKNEKKKVFEALKNSRVERNKRVDLLKQINAKVDKLNEEEIQILLDLLN